MVNFDQMQMSMYWMDVKLAFFNDCLSENMVEPQEFQTRGDNKV